MGAEAAGRQPGLQSRGRLNVGNLLGLHDGDNPHRWYSPANVDSVAYYITADLSKLDPKNADLLREPSCHVRDHATSSRYHRLIAQIKGRYKNVPGRRVGKHLRARWRRPSAST